MPQHLVFETMLLFIIEDQRRSQGKVNAVTKCVAACCIKQENAGGKNTA